MKISIALASYNGSAHIAEQLDSFLAQKRQPDELVIVDDHSSDGTVGIAEAFAEIAPFPVVIVVNDKNLGYAQNFDKALSLCSGDLVFLSDQDDVWFAEKIETIVRHVENDTGSACFINDARITNSELVPSTATKVDQIKAAGLPETVFVMGCCVAVRRSLLNIAVPIPQGARSHDDWLVGLSDSLNLTKRLPDILQHYRIHEKNVSKNFVNTIERIGKVQKYREYFRRLLKRFTTTNSLEREIIFCNQLKQRLTERGESCAAIIGSEKYFDCRETVEIRSDTLNRRYLIRAMQFHHRISPIATLWDQGGYKISGGVAGAIKDLMTSKYFSKN
jgi:glycosyltransferase involved in cell wall biosynthesis